MSKLNNDPLFQLIKSLNGPEKRYFKRYHQMVARKPDTLMLRLFELMDKASSYSEERILKAEKRIKPKVLSSMKTNLYTQLLKCLDNYHDNKSLTAKVNQYLRQFEILERKGLFQQSLKVIQKAERLALKYELLHLLTPIYYHYYKVNIPGKTMQQASAEYRSKVNNALEKINIATTNQLAHNEIGAYYVEKGYPRDANDSNFYQKLLDRVLLKKPFSGTSFISEVYYLSMLEILYGLVGNNKESIKNTSKIIMLFEQTPHQIKSRFGIYLSHMQNLAVGYLQLKKYNEALIVVEKIKNLKKEFPFIKKATDYQNNIFSFSFNTILSAKILTGDFKACKDLIMAFDTQTQNFLDNSINNFMKVQICYNIALANFGLANFRQTLRYLNEVIKMDKYIRGDLIIIVHLLQLITHYELGNFGQIEYKTRAVYRLLLKREKPYEIEKAIIRFIKSGKINEQNNKTRLKHFSNLKDELIKIQRNNRFESHFTYTFDIISWLESKIEEKPFATVIREKNNKT